MAPSLRGRLACFYCGSRSAQTRKPNLSSWLCEKCEAVNHLDENGDITDPPASGDYTNARYAHSIQRPASPVFDKPDESLFCQTCLKNQHVLAETLAAYFPSQDAPNYADFERAYPAYRRELEERYPQVCEQCAPRIQERIRATGYAAKTDHLRRMMERTRGHVIPRGESSWKSVLAFVGGTAWSMSLMGQIAWDGLVLSISGKEHEGLLDDEIALSGCIQQAMRGSDLGSGCTALATPMARLALLLGLLACWWNPKLQEFSRRRGGRMVGVSEYYKHQILLLFVRYLAYLYLDRTPSSDINLQKTLGIHAFLIFFCALFTVLSFRTIGIDYTPRVVFQDSPEPLISRQSQLGTIPTGPVRSNNILQQPISSTASSTPGARPFSINDLAPAPRQQYLTSYQPLYRPPTPPPDDDDDEAMDWTPSQQSTLRPATLYRTSSVVQEPQQNPFRGHLPADIVSQEHRLRNPPNKPMFRKASETSKQNFFRTPRKNGRDLDNVSDVGTEYEPSLADNLSPRFADPKLHLQSDQTPVTGLERLLASAFSLSDESPGFLVAQQEQAQAGHASQAFTSGGHAQWYRLPVLLLFTTSYIFWTSNPKPSLAAYEVKIRFATLFVAALASIRSLFLALRKDMVVWNGSDILIFTAEFAASVALILTFGDPSEGSFPNANPGTLHGAGKTLVAVLAVQELWLISQDVRNALRNGKTPSGQIHAPNPTPSVTPPALDAQQSGRRIEDDTPRQIASTVVQAGAKQSRSTRSRTSHGSGANSSNGFGGLSLGKENDQLASMDPRNLGQSRRQNRNGMW